MEETKNIFQSKEGTGIEEKFLRFFNCAVKSDTPAAIWRRPNDDTIQAIGQLDKSKTAIEEIENCPTGFVFTPFNKGKNREFIVADIFFNHQSGEFEQHTTCSKPQEKFDAFLAGYHKIDNSFQTKDYVRRFDSNTKNKSHFVSLVNKCKASIESGHYQKIVPSRQSIFALKKDFSPVTELFKLCQTYENAFISLVYMPGHGIWLGASPELLLSLENNRIFKTIALAGTQQIRTNFDLAKAAWTQKEIEEQALVSRYIINCFKQIRLREFEEYGPKTVKAGNLVHLKTEFSVDMEEVNFPQLGTVMLDLLHPTSAVCGMPMIPAAKFLGENEGYDRSFYSGYLGPVNVEGDTSLFVNLRCMRIFKGQGLLFAGAGVTEDSDPEHEWLETEMKFQTLLNVIGD